jgi:hypothetical protein
LFGRTPVPIWDYERRFDVFGDSIVLFRPGDRIKFVTVGKEQYDDIEARVKDGSYIHNVVGYQRFSVKNYKAWVASLDRNERF